MVKLLLEFGADIDLKGFARDSPLHDAARNGHLRVSLIFCLFLKVLYCANHRHIVNYEHCE